MPAPQTRGQSVTVIVGPGLNVDVDNLQRWCTEWGNELSVEAKVVSAADELSVVEYVRNARQDQATGTVLSAGLAVDSEALRSAIADADTPVVWVDLDEAERPRPHYIDQSGMAIRGRGIDGFRWALQLLLQRDAWPYQTIAYGSLRDQVGDLRLPSDPSPSTPIIALLHGGFWRERWERDTIEPLAIDLARRGYATWNLEYRRVGPFGGGWPTTCADVAAGLDFLASIARHHALDAKRVALVGHSAGGHLALWAAKRSGVEGAPAGQLSLIVALAGIADVVEAARRGLGDTGNGTADFMGGRPEEASQSYADASPSAALPLGVPQLIVQGRLDNTPDLVDMSPTYVRLARNAGDDVAFLELDDADHFHLIDPDSAAWSRVIREIEERFPLGESSNTTAVVAAPTADA